MHAFVDLSARLVTRNVSKSTNVCSDAQMYRKPFTNAQDMIHKYVQ